MKELLIIGASGFGREVAWLVERINQKEKTWNLLGFIDDNAESHGEIINGYPVIGGCEKIAEYPEAYVVCAVAASKVREVIISKIAAIAPNTKFATLIDPKVEMSNLIALGEGSIICAGSILTVNITIGKHVIVNLDCTIGHDAVLQDFVTLYPSVNVSGNSNLGHGCEIGTGTQIIQGKTVCEHCIVGAGAVVVKNITESGTYIGVPAKRKYDT